MKTKIGIHLIWIIAFPLYFNAIKAHASLSSKIASALKLPHNEAADRFYDLTVQYIIDFDIDSIKKNKALLISAIAKSEIPEKQALIYEIEAHSSRNFLLLNEAKTYAEKGLNEPKIPEKQFLRFLSLLAKIETGLENYLVAIEHYNIIEKMLLETAESEKKLIFNYIGLADLYLKTGLYQKSIETLNKGINLAKTEGIVETEHQLFKNKAIVYFYLNQPDSLKLYTKRAFSKHYRLKDTAVAFHRLNYMRLILANDSAAINEVRKVINSPKDDDELMSGFHLAQTYAQFNRLEKAKKFILVMLETGDLKNLTFLSSQLYKLLSDIYIKEKNVDAALFYYKKNVEQLTSYAEKQFKSDNMLTILKYHEIKTRYDKIHAEQQVRKNYLLLSIVIGAVIILALCILYYAVLTKKKYNKLAFEKLNNEIATINSHEIRKHLSNILGIISVIQLSDDKTAMYLEMEKPLLESAENLDVSIKNIANKISDYK